jgi:NDP-sugar pyrophosphorylase family protein
MDIETSAVENAIILTNSHIREISHLANSIIGQNVEISGPGKNSESTQLFIGDYSRIDL